MECQLSCTYSCVPPQRIWSLHSSHIRSPQAEAIASSLALKDWTSSGRITSRHPPTLPFRKWPCLTLAPLAAASASRSAASCFITAKPQRSQMASSSAGDLGGRPRWLATCRDDEGCTGLEGAMMRYAQG